MSDKNGLEISRRKALAGIGGIGVASAGAGLGTSAYFSDEESFEDNSLTAGDLDLKLDYRATYAGGPGRLDEVDSWYSDDGPGEPFEVEEEEEEGVYLIGEVPSPSEDEDWPTEVQEQDFCDDDAGLINGDEIPVFTLQDLKPGDSGEVTVSLHVCDNPAWMYMNGELTANDENGQTEPEADVDESGGDPGEGEGELADAIETTLWYDENCNNVLDGGDEETDSDPLCVQLVLDTSGSIGDDIGTVESAANDLANDILDANDDNSVGATTFSNGASVENSVEDE
ncbi:MAG: SipW-dependent-type signal peptide-containing protein, partial [Halanaeroarchaeum sp.]